MPLTKIDDRGLTTPIDLLDNEKIRLGTGNDLQIYHDGTRNIVEATGQLRLCGTTNVLLRASTFGDVGLNYIVDGGVELFYDNSKKFETTSYGALVTGTISAGSGNFDVADNGKFKAGNSSDLQIYHDGSESVIGNSTGTLQILSPNEIRYRATTHHFLAYGNDESMAKFIDDGAVELYYDNSKKFETNSTGAGVTGDFALSGELNMTTGGNYNRFIDASLDDNEALFLRSTNGGDANHQNMAIFHRAGSCQLYYASAKKLETTSGGVDFSHIVQCGTANDQGELRIGTDGTNYRARLVSNSTVSLEIDADGPERITMHGGVIYMKPINSETSAAFIANGAAELYHNNIKMFETTSTGIKLVGDTAFSLDPWQGRLDRLWSDYPSISISPSTTYGVQSEFRVHGISGASVGYGSGGDFSIDFRTDGNFQSGSDQRRKTNIEEITGALDTVKQLTGKKFNIINRQGELDPNKGTQKQFGLIAQECKDIIPEVVKFHPDEDTPNENGWASAYGLDYGQLTPLLINAVKELSTMVTTLETKVAALEAK